MAIGCSSGVEKTVVASPIICVGIYIEHKINAVAANTPAVNCGV